MQVSSGIVVTVTSRVMIYCQRLPMLLLLSLPVGIGSAHAESILEYQRLYPPEIFDFCMEKHRENNLDRASRCMRDESSEKRTLMSYLRKKIRNGDYREELYQVCVDEEWLQGMDRVSDCAHGAVSEMDRARAILSYIEKEISDEDAQRKLRKICFEEWDGSPVALLQYKTKDISHCVKTKARYYRLHGRF